MIHPPDREEDNYLYGIRVEKWLINISARYTKGNVFSN